MGNKVWFTILLCGTAALPAQASEPKETPPVLVLTAVENGVEPQQNFTCYGKIHGYIRLPKRESDAHVLEGRWTSPAGKIAAESRTTVDLKPARSTAYVWFAFPESANILGTPDANLEQDRLSYNGRWQVEVLWDDHFLLKQDFNVRCP